MCTATEKYSRHWANELGIKSTDPTIHQKPLPRGMVYRVGRPYLMVRSVWWLNGVCSFKVKPSEVDMSGVVRNNLKNFIYCSRTLKPIISSHTNPRTRHCRRRHISLWRSHGSDKSDWSESLSKLPLFISLGLSIQRI